MQNLVRSYNANAPLIQKFILTTLAKASPKAFNMHLSANLYKTFPSLELIYKTDEGFVQNSPNVYVSKEEHYHVGADRSYLVDEIALQQGYYISEPYISTATGHLCITVVYAVEDGYLFFRLPDGRYVDDIDNTDLAYDSLARITETCDILSPGITATRLAG